MTITVESLLAKLRSQPTTLSSLTEEEREFLRHLFQSSDGWTAEQCELLDAWHLLVPVPDGLAIIEAFNETSGLQVGLRQAEEGWVISACFLSDPLNYPPDILPFERWVLLEDPTFLPSIDPPL